MEPPQAELPVAPLGFRLASCTNSSILARTIFIRSRLVARFAGIAHLALSSSTPLFYATLQTERTTAQRFKTETYELREADAGS